MLTSTVSVLDALYNRLEHPLARLAHPCTFCLSRRAKNRDPDSSDLRLNITKVF